VTFLRFDCKVRYRSGFTLGRQFELTESVTAIVGPSGSGKTTILNLIAGVMPPDEGQIELHARTLYNSKHGVSVPMEDRRIGYVFQEPSLFPHRTVGQNLRFGLRFAKLQRVSMDQVVQVMGLGSLLDRYPNSLSGGQKQRVALGRALLSSPDLLMLDEPLNAIDRSQRGEMFGFVKQVLEQYAIPMIFVSHDEDSVTQMAKTIVRLS
jgi:molybdate transport system ATP-binding protein